MSNLKNNDLGLQIVSVEGLGDKIIFEFNQDVYSSLSTLSPGDIFSIKINGSEIEKVSGWGYSSWKPKELDLNLRQPIHYNDQITISYTASPNGGNIYSLSGDYLLDFDDLTVTNMTSDQIRPKVESVYSYGRFIEMTADEHLHHLWKTNQDNDYLSLFEVQSNQGTLEIESIQTSFFEPNLIGIWLKEPIKAGVSASITLNSEQIERRDYVVQDDYGNDLQPFTNLEINVQPNDSDAPELIHVFLNSYGSLELVFNEDVGYHGFIDGPSSKDFTINVGGVKIENFTGTGWSPSEANIRTLHSSNLPEDVKLNEFIGLSYEKGSYGSLMDKHGNETDSFDIQVKLNTRFAGQISETPNSLIQPQQLLAPIKVNETSFQNAILGSASSDKIVGTGEDEIIYGASSRDRMEGNGGSDAFVFKNFTEFGQKVADIIVDFDSSDSILIDSSLISDGTDIDIAFTRSRKEIVNASKTDVNFIYNITSGHLFFNENGSNTGLGQGGLFVRLLGAPQIFSTSVQLIS